MKKQSDYKVVSGTKAQEVEFQALVNGLLNQSYILAGGVQTVAGGGLTQSLVRETETPMKVQVNAVSAPEAGTEVTAKKIGRPKKEVV